MNPQLNLTVANYGSMIQFESVSRNPLMKLLKSNFAGIPSSTVDTADIVMPFDSNIADRARLVFHEEMKSLIDVIHADGISDTCCRYYNNREYATYYAKAKVAWVARAPQRKAAILKAIRAWIVFLFNSQVVVVFEAAA